MIVTVGDSKLFMLSNIYHPFLLMLQHERLPNKKIILLLNLFLYGFKCVLLVKYQASKEPSDVRLTEAGSESVACC